jgi:hypothetical protein
MQRHAPAAVVPLEPLVPLVPLAERPSARPWRVLRIACSVFRDRRIKTVSQTSAFLSVSAPLR